MNSRRFVWKLYWFGFLLPLALVAVLVGCAGRNGAVALPQRHDKTLVSIIGDEFQINGHPTYQGRMWNGKNIQGLLLNSRMVQGIFDDRNPTTVTKWAYPDSHTWDPERNTREFIAAMGQWRSHGLLAFTINLQGGSPQGYSSGQPWHNSAIESDGSLRPDYMARLERIIDRADELGMVVILGYFYFGQDERLKDEAAVIRATDNATHWLFDKGYQNVIVEINNECNVRYDHPVLQPARVHELIQRVQQTGRNGRHLLVGTSYGGGALPTTNVVAVSDFILLHGNGVSNPDRISDMIRKTRAIPGFKPKPILFNEDDHFDFDKPKNNFHAALNEHASWGYFDPGESNYRDGYQCPPVQWSINTDRKRAFFGMLADVTGTAVPASSAPTPQYSLTRVRRAEYHGWKDAVILANGKAEVIVVPAIGRVMQFKFVGDADGPFFENRALDGKSPDPKSNDWGNFGGDKTWPSPQADWPKVTPRGWPPPIAFDSMPVEVMVDLDAVVLKSPIDPSFGIRTQRRVSLVPEKPEMQIVTTYEKIEGVRAGLAKPEKVGVWIITQLKHPQLMAVPIPRNARNVQGYNKQSDKLPLDLQFQNGLLILKRNTTGAYKIGTDAESLLWIGVNTIVKIDSPRVRDAEYPDQSSSAEIYTNPDPLPYVELEMLGPLHTLKVGDRISQTNTYTLIRRIGTDAEKEARAIVGR